MKVQIISKENNMKKTKLFIILTIILGMLLTGCNGGSISSSDDAPIDISGPLENYVQMYNEKTLTECEGKRIEVYGAVSEIMSPTLFYIGDYDTDNLEIFCYFSKATEETKNLKVGDFVKVNGICANTFGGFVYIQDCSLTAPKTAGTDTGNSATNDSAQSQTGTDSAPAETTAAHVHEFTEATCTAPKTCSVCKATEGKALGHTYANGLCTQCNAKEPDPSTDVMVWIPTRGGIRYHTDASCSDMDGPVEVTVTEAEAQGFTPCAKCYT